jgi:hypothetical protein
MKKYCAALFVVALLAALALPAVAQGAGSAEVKEKPRLYTYVALWSLPRGQWADWAKEQANDEKTLQDAMAKGTLVGYGDDANLVHQPDAPTHDDWFQSMSMAGLMNVLDQFYKSGATTSGTQMAATKHWDEILVSRYYNWKPGAIKDGYSYGSSYKLKDTADDDTIDTLAKTAIVPLMEKMLSTGVIQQYEIDTEAVHTEAPGTFYIFWVANNADALDKVQASLRDALKANPLIGSAFDSAIDFKAHRDFLSRTNANYK